MPSRYKNLSLIRNERRLQPQGGGGGGGVLGITSDGDDQMMEPKNP